MGGALPLGWARRLAGSAPRPLPPVCAAPGSGPAASPVPPEGGARRPGPALGAGGPALSPQARPRASKPSRITTSPFSPSARAPAPAKGAAEGWGGGPVPAG